jgi:hypothetical protein
MVERTARTALIITSATNKLGGLAGEKDRHGLRAAKPWQIAAR